jgi:hypothetical protein
MHRTDWFYESNYGVMFHFMPQPWKETEQSYPLHEPADLPSPAEWNQLVDGFDIEAVADQLSQVKAGYLLLSLGQTSGYYLAPNPVYDEIAGFCPGERCSTRDLPSELHRVLDRHGLRLMLYLPVETAAEVEPKFGRKRGDATARAPRPDAFIERWAQVIQWWSDHYGSKVAGWWFDGQGDTPEQNKRLVAAVRHGNPDCITNLGEFGDYTGGHCAVAHHRRTDPEWYGRIDWDVQIERLPEGRFTADGQQWHALLHLGEHWWDRDGFYDTETEVAYSRAVIDRGGVITWDCGPDIGRSEGPIGTISDVQMTKLRCIQDVIRGA